MKKLPLQALAASPTVPPSASPLPAAALVGLVVLAGLCVPCLGPAAAAEEAAFRHFRTLSVESAGWVRVALDGPAQVHGRPDADWRVFDPEGRQLVATVLEPVRERVALRTLSVSEIGQDEGCFVEFDVGPRPCRHRQIRVESAREVNARGCVLEASADRRAWRELGKGDLFKLGEQEGLRRSTIDYAPTELRYLRLRWPKEGGFPELRAASVEPAEELPGSPTLVAIPMEVAPAPGAASAAILRLPRGQLPLVALELEVAAPGDFAVSVELAEGGRWSPLAGGARVAGADARSASGDVAGAGTRKVRIARDAWSGRSRTLGVRLFTRAGESARLVSAVAILPPLWVLFEAPTAGAYELRYGAWTPPAEVGTVVDIDRIATPIADAILGEERTSPSPPLPEEATRPAPPSREPWAARSYRVLAESAVPGEIVRLELPDPVIAELAEVRGSLRLRLDDRDAPFVRWLPDEPALILDRKDLDPVPPGGADGGATGGTDGGAGSGSRRAGTDRTSRIVLDLPPGKSELSGVVVTAPGRVIGRRVVVSVDRAHRPGVEDSEVVLADARWACAEDRGTDILPCELALDLGLPRGDWEHVALTFHDGDREPLRGLRVALWRRRSRMAFPWPGGEPRLLVISDGERQPAGTTLEMFRERILDMPWKEGRLDLEGATAEENAARIVRRWWLVAALAIVSAVLLWVLARSLRHGTPAGSPPSP